MHGWILFLTCLASFTAGWLIRQIYGGGIIRRLQNEKAVLETEVLGLRTKAGSWIGGKQQPVPGIAPKP